MNRDPGETGLVAEWKLSLSQRLLPVAVQALEPTTFPLPAAAAALLARKKSFYGKDTRRGSAF